MDMLSQSSSRDLRDLSPPSSWCESIFEAADLVEHRCAQSSGVGTKKMLPPNSDCSLLQQKTVSEYCCTMPANHFENPHHRLDFSTLNRLNLSAGRRATERSHDVHCVAGIKSALNVGRRHVTSSGKVRKGRCLKSPCHQDCKRCEGPRLSDGERLSIFNTFWSLGNHERQWMYLLGSVTSAPPKKKFALPGSKGEKHWSRTYHFTICGRKRRVCKTMFKSTLCICDSWIDSALSHFSSNGLLPDLRGRHKRTRRK